MFSLASCSFVGGDRLEFATVEDPTFTPGLDRTELAAWCAGHDAADCDAPLIHSGYLGDDFFPQQVFVTTAADQEWMPLGNAVSGAPLSDGFTLSPDGQWVLGHGLSAPVALDAFGVDDLVTDPQIDTRWLGNGEWVRAVVAEGNDDAVWEWLDVDGDVRFELPRLPMVYLPDQLLVSPDGARLVAVDGPLGTSQIWTLAAGADAWTPLVDDEAWQFFPRGGRPGFTPDGAELITRRVADPNGDSGVAQLVAIDLVSGDVRELLEFSADLTVYDVVSPDGELVALGHARTGEVRVVEVATGDVWSGLEMCCFLVTGSSFFPGLSWSPDGTFLATGDGLVARVDRDGQQLVGPYDLRADGNTSTPVKFPGAH